MSHPPAATTPSRRPVSVDELKRAWGAVQAGEFRSRAGPCGGVGPDGERPTSGLIDATPGGDPADPFPGPGTGAAARSRWESAPDERVLPVLGCAGSMGTTTLALAIATAAAPGSASTAHRGTVRVVECGSATASGLAAASTAELGRHASGWRQGKRDHVLLQRLSHDLSHPADLPTPIPVGECGREPRQRGNDEATPLTVLDVSLPVDQVLATGCWLTATILQAPAIVLVTAARIPGLRRLEGALELLDRAAEPSGEGDQPPAAVWVAVVGPTRAKWPKGVAHSAGPRTRRLLNTPDRLVTIPEDRALAVRGLDSSPLPRPLLQAVQRLVARTVAPCAVAPCAVDQFPDHAAVVASEQLDLADLLPTGNPQPVNPGPVNPEPVPSS